MTKEEAKIVSETMVEMCEVTSAKTIDLVKNGFEKFKTLEVPRVSQDGQYCYGISHPYKENKDLQQLVDFMITYLDVCIESINIQIEKNKEKAKKEEEK